jgi:hypothetical protein
MKTIINKKIIKKYYIFIVIICILIFLGILVYFFYENNKIISSFLSFKTSDEYYQNNSNIIFLNSEELFDFLRADYDNYYKTFLNYDFSTRNIKNIDDYIPKIKASVTDFTDLEKKKLITSILYINSKINNLNLPYFNGNLGSKIPWKLGLIDGTLYENGYPHTRNDIIILSRNTINAERNMNEGFDSIIDKSFTQTLIHERIHIYQKMYPEYVKIYLSKNNFMKIKDRDINDNIRANPDINQIVYKDEGGNIYKAIYNNNPKTIGDINYAYGSNQSFEHPYEKMAIEFEKYIN